MSDNPQEPDRLHIGAIQFFNSLPLIYGLNDCDEIVLYRDVPARLGEYLESGICQAALIPSIDVQRSDQPLWILPAGAIGSKGEVLTVQLFSRVPLEEVRCVGIDPDSHTATVLQGILFRLGFDRSVEVVSVAGDIRDYETVLQIGDKVIEQLRRWPYQVDLGRWWADLAGVPFVYAVWVAVSEEMAERVFPVLSAARAEGLSHLDTLADRYGGDHGFGREQGRHYFAEHICYDFGPEQVAGLKRFYELAYEMGLIESLRPVRIFDGRPRAVRCESDGQ